MSEHLPLYLVAFFTACVAIGLWYPLSVRIGLVDIPRGRKQHQGAVPLIGGIATYCGLATALLLLADCRCC